MSMVHLAFDLGASSGRAIIGQLDGSPPRLRLAEVHRFEHAPCLTPTGPIWDLTGIWQHLLAGLRAATRWCEDHQVQLCSVGVDTWGVDWVLLGKSGEVLSQPHCYRDPRNELACQQTLDKLGGFAGLYQRNGIQLLPFNTLFQLTASHANEPRLFEAADRLMLLPDLLHFWLSGTAVNEQTIASTSAMLTLDGTTWDLPLLEELSLPTHLFGDLVQPGTVLGPLRAELAESSGAPTDLLVVTPAAHDTASAVVAVPAIAGDRWAYLSSGTWSLLGAELDAPVVTDAARSVPFTNERGAEDTVRFLKNIAGLWLVQELRRELANGGKTLGFEELTAEAERADPFRTLIDPNHASFAQPGHITEKIRRFARDTGQPEPDSIGTLVRCCLDSLAMSYRHTVDQLESVLGERFSELHIVGGGTQNQLLNRLTAEAVERLTIVGPTEATAIGNLLSQAKGCGSVGGLAEIREIVARSFPCARLEATAERIDQNREMYLSIAGA